MPELPASRAAPGRSSHPRRLEGGWQQTGQGRRQRVRVEGRSEQGQTGRRPRTRPDRLLRRAAPLAGRRAEPRRLDPQQRLDAEGALLGHGGGMAAADSAVARCRSCVGAAERLRGVPADTGTGAARHRLSGHPPLIEYKRDKLPAASQLQPSIATI